MRTQGTAGRIARPAVTERRLELVVDGGALYWLRLAVKPSATLADLDRFLRLHWLDCGARTGRSAGARRERACERRCDHLSAFTIRGEEYAMETGGPGMRARVGDVVDEGERFAYVYDFGHATELMLHVVGAARFRASRVPVRLVAENEPPPLSCAGCGAAATLVCSGCVEDEKGWLCGRCAGGHACDGERLLPIVNSPRVGVCSYGRAA